MYKMKQVCQLTGLTEKTVRFYVEQKLLAPRVEPGLHYRSYCFDDGDIERLRDIAALRSAEFSISDIRRMLEDPNAIAALVMEREGLIAAKISAMQSVQRALENLTVSERTDVSKVADAIDPRTPLRKETPKNARNRPLWLSVYIGVFLLMGVLTAGSRLFWPLCLALVFLAGVEFPIMAAGYFRYNRRYRSSQNHGLGRVVAVVPDEGIGEFWEESTWEALHGLLNLGFFHWNWVRPDHWVPLIQFEAGGTTVTTAYRYGGLKNSWAPGETLSIAWDEGKETQIYPQGDPVIRRKAWVYLLLGLACMAAFWVAVITMFAG